MADFPSHPPATLLRTTPQASKPASIRALVTFYQIASSLRKWTSGFKLLRRGNRLRTIGGGLRRGGSLGRHRRRLAPYRERWRGGNHAWNRQRVREHLCVQRCAGTAGMLLMPTNPELVADLFRDK